MLITSGSKRVKGRRGLTVTLLTHFRDGTRVELLT